MPKKTSKALERTTSTALAHPKRFAIGNTEVRPEQFYRLPERQPSQKGPWSDEPDKLAWVDPETNLDCIILRQENGTLSGYVAVHPDHPLYGYNHDALPLAVRNASHRGIDFAEPCQQRGPEPVRVCHVRLSGVPSDAPGRDPHDDKWWFGFRTSYPGDLVPVGMKPDRHREDGELYRDIHYVFEEVSKLANALWAVEHQSGKGGDLPPQLVSHDSDGENS